jgi:hypothetical protein
MFFIIKKKLVENIVRHHNTTMTDTIETPDLSPHTFVRICHYLSTGMILRCGAVCKNWRDISNNDDIWIIILGTELRNEVGLSLQRNTKLNREIAIIWNLEFQAKHKGAHVKDVYMKLRRSKIMSIEKSHPGYKKKNRIFPYSDGVPTRCGATHIPLLDYGALVKFLHEP